MTESADGERRPAAEAYQLPLARFGCRAANRRVGRRRRMRAPVHVPNEAGHASARGGVGRKGFNQAKPAAERAERRPCGATVTAQSAGTDPNGALLPRMARARDSGPGAGSLGFPRAKGPWAPVEGCVAPRLPRPPRTAFGGVRGHERRGESPVGRACESASLTRPSAASCYRPAWPCADFAWAQ